MRLLTAISLALVVLMALACTATPTAVPPTAVPPTVTPTICDKLSTDLSAARTEAAVKVLSDAWIENGCQDGSKWRDESEPEDKSDGKPEDKSESEPEDKSEPQSSCLTAGEIFQLNDADQLSDEKAAAMLKELKQGKKCFGSGLKKEKPLVVERPAEKDNPDKSEEKSEETPSSKPKEQPEKKSGSNAKRGTLEWVNQLEESIHMLVNEERNLESLSVLSYDDKLSDIARAHSEDMARNGYFDHVSPQNQGPTDRANSSGYTCTKTVGSFIYSGIAENIFSGWLYSSITYFGPVKIKDYMSLNEIAAEVVDGWMGSPGHRQNILTKMYDREGIGVAVNPDNEELLVTQNFC